MKQSLMLFISMFTTLVAIINPLEALPVFLSLVGGKDKAAQTSVARRSCLYAMLLMLFFLLFGRLILELFGVPLSMVRIVGGIVLMKIGFELFSPSASNSTIPSGKGASEDDVAFVPMSMPIMFGPGAIATIIGMASTVRLDNHPVLHFGAISLAIVLTMLVIYMFLANAHWVMKRVGPKGVDAASRMVGFFVSAMGMGLIFHGVIEAGQSYGMIPLHPTAQ